jgi:hypothetical protein
MNYPSSDNANIPKKEKTKVKCVIICAPFYAGYYTRSIVLYNFRPKATLEIKKDYVKRFEK